MTDDEKPEPSAPAKKPKSKLGQLLLVALGTLVAIGLLSLLDVASFDLTHSQTNSSLLAERNGIWLRFWWYTRVRTAAEKSEMLSHLNLIHSAYSFFHVLGTKSDGSLEYHKKENARALVDLVHNGCPKTRVIAWVYVPSWPAKNGLRLEDKAVRAKLVEEAKWLVDEGNFDGVQWDYEFAVNRHPGLPLLLQETRAALPGTYIGACTPMRYPGILWGWSDDYFAQVAASCDQIAVMGYDSYSPFPSLYAWLMEQQVRHAARAVSGTRCTFIIGVPTYEDQTAAHHYWVENLKTSLAGVRAGLDKLTPQERRSFDGIAPFAEYTTDTEEWALLNRVLR